MANAGKYATANRNGEKEIFGDCISQELDGHRMRRRTLWTDY